MKMKLGILIMMMALISLECHAQRQFQRQLKSTSQSIQGFSDYNVGLKIGCPWSYMPKTSLSATTYDGNFGYSVGVLGEWNLRLFSLGLECSFAQKGTSMHNERPYQIGINSYGILKTSYHVDYNAVTVRVPVTYYFKGMIKDDVLVPYVFIGPEFDASLPFFFNINTFEIEDTPMAITEKYDGPKGEHLCSTESTPFNMFYNLSTVAGLGLMGKWRFENSAILFKLDTAFNYGLRNLAPSATKGASNTIHAHDIEVNLSIILPIKKILRDACYYL